MLFELQAGHGSIYSPSGTPHCFLLLSSNRDDLGKGKDQVSNQAFGSDPHDILPVSPREIQSWQFWGSPYLHHFLMAPSDWSLASTKESLLGDSPGGPGVKTRHFLCREHRFNTWSGD